MVPEPGYVCITRIGKQSSPAAIVPDPFMSKSAVGDSPERMISPEPSIMASTVVKVPSVFYFSGTAQFNIQRRNHKADTMDGSRTVKINLKVLCGKAVAPYGARSVQINMIQIGNGNGNADIAPTTGCSCRVAFQ